MIHDLLVLSRVSEYMAVASPLTRTLILFLHLPSVLVHAETFSEDGGSAESSSATDQVNSCDACEIMEASLLKPAATPVPGGYHWINEAGQEEGEHDVGVQLCSLCK